MPELPEVEIIVRNLRKYLVNKKIIRIDVFFESIIKNNELFSKIYLKTFLDIQRKGKFLLFFLSDGLVLVGHLRMEGKFGISNIKQISSLADKHEHFRIFLENNLVLRYYDFRKFGRFIVYKKEDYLTQSSLRLVAPDPFDITVQQFYKSLQKSNIVIKKNLLNQRIISGIGNIYASEILFFSKIHPETKSSLISFEQTNLIIKESKRILTDSILSGGSSISSFEVLGKRGTFQNKLLVYGKYKSKCFFCFNIIQKKKIGGRSSYFCVECQKLQN
ncbi:DNA-formamidopyrimidine glycosylase [Candidatus Phytoplasma sacchari]|uniref:DNA-formamidopyrimidine glycosylase n=1 Tax=Candidatus Phytoplasma sacchari TaxID=2609813 RepID=A0ABY7M146_9MOLU|nr:DNA-formamidopyrimidine glycosylase [Candidatus Phytoplasma sacchari]KAB8122869.1 DNA-formamidopyrimidine glycosylase [Candidatus Phytoplasma sacchari]WBL31359.1 DNA-formamidopyrimidine glycosylase [Candidatus Phytoplasma sacchari]